ncbi:hypothetical protein MSP8887_00773 [Marinomonas spartinae]|nr:hypothetical protein MSP8887_00773 [Marinomonas spartinae]
MQTTGWFHQKGPSFIKEDAPYMSVDRFDYLLFFSSCNSSLNQILRLKRGFLDDMSIL